MEWNIRRVTLEESEAIAEVLADSFGEEALSLMQLLHQLEEDSELTLALLAYEGEEPVGFIAFSPVDIDDQPDWARLEGLAPLGVKTAWQRQGVGKALIRRGLTYLNQIGVDAVVVLGAASYYSKFGFEWARPLGIDNEYGANRDFRILALTPDCLPHLHGLARYASAFGSLEG